MNDSRNLSPRSLLRKPHKHYDYADKDDGGGDDE